MDGLRLLAGKAAARRTNRRVSIGGADWGMLRRHTPVSTAFGFDRGQPVDRWYIDRFLRDFSTDIQGRVLEIGDDTYTRALSKRDVTRTDILHVDASNPRATIVGDLAHSDHIPSNTFDCVILTQTLHLIYDMQAAARTLHRILRPNGVLLATVPGITPLSSDRWSKTWYWSLTELSARRLFEEAFGREVVTHTAGNVCSATAFLYGFAAEELSVEELDQDDARYPVIIGIRAMK
jgi:SAM-dependent methyltransferase